jgi:hypothetical protein
MNKRVSPLLAITVIIIIAILTGGFIWRESHSPIDQVQIVRQYAKPRSIKDQDSLPGENNNTACTMEAKLCPDGSSVSRVAPDCQFAPCPEKAADIYTNAEYGFQITIPEGYAGWKAMVEKDYGGKGITYIHMIFPTKDPQWKTMAEENFVTHEKFPGYSSIFAFTVWDKDVFEKASKECEKNPTPDCPDTVLGKNSKYVIDVSTGNGVPPKDLEALRKMLTDSKEIGKILDFKFTN